VFFASESLWISIDFHFPHGQFRYSVFSNPVNYECVQNVVLITINNPPVNALSHAVRNGLATSITRFEKDSKAHVAVIVGNGKLFSCGADIAEFNKPSQAPHLADVILQIERCSKPVVAAMHGTALGGGLEVAMGAHYRIALAQTVLGMPEVKLGLIPGAGGTQRLPRLVGFENALSMVTTGDTVDAAQCVITGLVDKLYDEDDAGIAGVSFARELLAKTDSSSTLVRRTGDHPVSSVSDKMVAKWRLSLSESASGIVAPAIALQAIEASINLSYELGLKEEKRLFTALMGSPQKAGMIHAFYAERRVCKIEEVAGARPIEITHMGIVGGGTMGAGIATAALLGGLTVSLVERDTKSANKARSTIEENLDGAVRRGKLDVKSREHLEKCKLITGTHYSTLAQSDLIIEAVFECMDVKKQVFQAMDSAAKPGAILATNTSYLDVNEIASCVKRPEAVMGLHFFSPAHVMKLMEVVAAEKTPPELVATGFALATKLGKRAVRSGVCDGFIGNRILRHYRTAADHMVLDGASPYQIDKALTDYGFAMGPFAVADLAGLDIGYAARQRMTPFRHQRERYPNWADDLYHEGRLGQKTGKGYYVYPDGARKGLEDPHVEELVAQARHEAGLTPRAFSDEEIVTRYMSAMINEAARVVDEGIALRPSDVDVVLLHGYGFPRWRGGPMHTADQMGLPAVLQNIQLFAEADDYFWQTAPLLERLIAEKRNFSSLN